MKIRIYIVCAVALLMACNPVKHLPENDRLYTGAGVQVEADELSKGERKELAAFAKGLIRPLPNSKLAGIPYKLMVYQWTGGEATTKGVKNWLQNKLGEAPVLYSRVDPAFTSRLIQNELDNKGYFRAAVDYDTVQQSKKVKVNYRVNPGRVYRIAELAFPDDSTVFARAIRATQDASLLKSGRPYSLDLIIAERERIDAVLKEQGFYYFSPDQLLVQADSTVGDHQVNLRMIIKPETPRLAFEQYYVRNVRIEPAQDFREGVLEEMLDFQRNSLYNRTNHNLALHRLVSMGNFQFVRNRFVTADTTGNYLDAIYTLTPFPSKSLQAELSARTNSADFSGTALSANWSHRNAFRGGELLNVAIFGAMDFQMGKGTAYNLYRTGVETSIVWPRLVAPFRAAPTGRFIPKTRASVGYELQHRSQLYTKHQFSGSFGYQWKTNSRSDHRLMVTDITYANPAFVSPMYRGLMAADPGLGKSVERELIVGPSYIFEYTTTMEQQRAHRFYSKSSVQTSAVLMGLLSGASAQQAEPKRLMGVPFSQFIRLEQEYRHFYRLAPGVELAGRIVAGAGIPFGNSDALPYARQFFIGGSNSLRAFPARSLGPGTFLSPVAGNNFIPDASGDLKLEMNAELRTKLFSFIHGALFVDAGNVWLLNDNPQKPGGTISTDFLNELAVGAGAGLRLDFTMLVVRLDLAMPLYKPWLPAGNRSVTNDADFGTSLWWKNNRMWNIAIGYPF
jgi:outer membrane protein assembly factor BamA